MSTPETRTQIATALLAARLRGMSSDTPLEDREIAFAIDAADRLILAIKNTYAAGHIGEPLPASETEPVGEPEPSAPYVIAGITPAQYETLLATFPTAEALDAASDEEIERLKGIGQAAVTAIRLARSFK